MSTLASAVRFPLIILLSAFILLGSITSVAQAPSVSPRESSVKSRPPSRQFEIDALKADVSQMKVVLNQMATNLAAVSDSQSPLKHQFQLDIEMWQIVIMQTQHRIDRMEHDQETDVH
jgi:hypothetical protein